MRDAVQKIQNDILIPKPNRVRHRLDSETKTTIGMGKLYPVYLRETAPGDEITISSESLFRFQPLSSPLMHKMDGCIDYYFVPFRLLWDNWENFIMGKKDPLTGLDPAHPQFPRSAIATDTTNTAHTNPRLHGYFGFRPKQDNSPDSVKFSPFAHAAYQLIWNANYRHKAIQQEALYKLQDGDITANDLAEITKLRGVVYQDDYFNQALPSPQQGEPVFVDNHAEIKVARPAPFIGTNSGYTDTVGGGTMVIPAGTPNPNDGVPFDKLYADVQIITEEIRRAAALQKVMEMDRHTQYYPDYLKAYHNVRFPDSRAQLPEYITGSRQSIIVSEVMNNADNQGRITGNAATMSRGGRDTYYAHEHGIVIGLAFVTYKPTYNFALPKVHTKKTRFDYYLTQIDGLGEQPILRGELDARLTNFDETFGYAMRYAEYRKAFDIATGEMNSLYMHWHLARNLAISTVLSEDFFDVVDERRIFQFQQDTHDPIMLQVYTDVTVESNIAQLPETIL